MDTNDEKEISHKSWDKLINRLHQEGFRVGSSAGIDETFQKGFDSGYEYGFEVGYKLGLHNGILQYFSSKGNSLDDELKRRLSTVKPYENPSRGCCVMCEGELHNSSSSSKESDSTTFELLAKLSDIKEQQKKVVQTLSSESYTTVLKSVNL